MLIDIRTSLITLLYSTLLFLSIVYIFSHVLVCLIPYLAVPGCSMTTIIKDIFEMIRIVVEHRVAGVIRPCDHWKWCWTGELHASVQVWWRNVHVYCCQWCRQWFVLSTDSCPRYVVPPAVTSSENGHSQWLVCCFKTLPADMCHFTDLFIFKHHLKTRHFNLYFNTHNRFTAILDFVRDYPGEQVPER